MPVKTRLSCSRIDSREGSIGWWSRARTIVFTMIERLMNHPKTFDYTTCKKNLNNRFLEARCMILFFSIIFTDFSAIFAICFFGANFFLRYTDNCLSTSFFCVAIYIFSTISSSSSVPAVSLFYIQPSISFRIPDRILPSSYNPY